MIRLGTIALLICTSANAQAPLSAIDWLSESLKNPPESFEFRIDTAPLIPPITPEIEVTNGVGHTSPDAIGILGPSVTGFSINLWGNMSTKEVVSMLQHFPNNGTPEGNRLFRRILLAQANPTFDINQPGDILNARITRLFQMGALDEAEALVAIAQPLNPLLFGIAFDTAILTDRTTQVCNALKAAPALSSDLSTRVYCLVRGGDWNAAAITLSLGATIGAIEPAREEMLVRYLDPELFEGEPDPSMSDTMEPMDFVLREALLLPRPSGVLPLPYIYRDIGLRAPLRARIEALERLVKAGAMPSNLLFTAYRTGKAASSGGVWGRENAIQMLDKALEGADAEKISIAIIEASKTLGDVGLLEALSREYAEVLAKLEYTAEFKNAADQIITLLHMANISAPSWETQTERTPAQILAQDIVARAPLQIDESGDVMLTAITRAITQVAPKSANARQVLEMLEIGNQGQAILTALNMLSNGGQADPESIHIGLYVLTMAGQTATARRIAVQILLMPNGG